MICYSFICAGMFVNENKNKRLMDAIEDFCLHSQFVSYFLYPYILSFYILYNLYGLFFYTYLGDKTKYLSYRMLFIENGIQFLKCFLNH